jgi:RES domain
MRLIDTLKKILLRKIAVLLGDTPGIHPQPKEDLDPLIYVLEKGSELFRVHQSRYPAKYFNPDSSWRFNDPVGGEYGVLYAALDYSGAMRETIPSGEFNIISKNFLKSRRLSKVTPNRDLRLVDLTGEGLTHIGADARLTTGSYQISQLWSQALYRHSSNVDGLYYCSRHDPSKFCVVLYEHRVKLSDLDEESVTKDNLCDLSFNICLQKFIDLYKYKIK